MVLCTEKAATQNTTTQPQYIAAQRAANRTKNRRGEKILGLPVTSAPYFFIAFLD